jgi:hypothetical protein
MGRHRALWFCTILAMAVLLLRLLLNESSVGLISQILLTPSNTALPLDGEQWLVDGMLEKQRTSHNNWLEETHGSPAKTTGEEGTGEHLATLPLQQQHQQGQTQLQPHEHERQQWLLSADRPARASAAGNLASVQVVTRNTPPTDWLRDRWQAARDMSGTPLPAPQWVAVELEAGCSAQQVVLDWETACADIYDVQVRGVGRGWEQWRTLETTRISRKISPQHVVDDLRLQPRQHDGERTATRDGESRALEYRIYVRKLATRWGVSLWRIQLWGDCAGHTPPAASLVSKPGTGMGPAPVPVPMLASLPPPSRGLRRPGSSNSASCLALKRKHGVLPGQSWGSLSEAQITEWKTRRCDQFFCKPSHMEAVGQYHCVPL